MEYSMYILHEVHRPLIIFICAQQPHVQRSLVRIIRMAASQTTGLITGK